MSTKWSTANPRRLAPQVLDEKAKNNPNGIYARVPISHIDFSQGFQDLTNAQVANGVNGVAQWFREKFYKDGKNESSFETLCYLGANDFKHPLLVLGAIKAEFKMMFLSLREVLPAHINSLVRMECTKVLVSRIGEYPFVDEIVNALPMITVLEIPSVSYFIGRQWEHFPYDKTFEEAQDEPFAVVATSGTTGLPKAIVYTHLWASKWVADRYVAPPEGYEKLDHLFMGNTWMSVGPPSHASTMWSTVLWPLYCENVTVLPPRDAPPSIELVVEGVIAAKLDCTALFPPLVEALAVKPHLIDRLASEAPNTTYFYCGGCISYKAGDIISAKLRLWNLTGSSETGIWPGLRPKGPWDSRTWQYHLFHPAAGIGLRQISPTLYSGIIVKKGDAHKILEQPAFAVFQDQDEVDSGDVFSPLKLEGYETEQLWTIEGRKDDLQNMLNAYKWNPTDTEHKIAYILRDTPVTQVLIASNGLPYTVIILETAHDPSVVDIEAANQKILEEHWPEIAKLNDSLAEESHLDKRLIVFASAGKAMQRSVKGTVRRVLTIKDYENEIYACLARAGWNRGDYVEL